MKSRIYYPHLDTLRVFFVFLVLSHHWLSKNPFMFLPFGSTIAFVLSGFLLTGPLLYAKKEKETYWANTINFLGRRLLRTIPVYLLVLLGYFILNVNNFRQYGIYFITFTQNYLIAYNGNLKAFPVGYAQTWSLAVQEQFYVLIPIVIYILPSKYFVKFFIALTVLGLAIRLNYFYLHLPFTYNHFTSECCIDCFSIGVLVAYYHMEHPTKLKFFLSNKSLLLGIILLYVVSILGYTNNSKDELFGGFDNLYRITERTFVSLLSIWFIAWGIYYPTNFLDKISSSIFMKYSSKISYGIYIYHFAVASVIKRIVMYIGIQYDYYTWYIICFNFIFTIMISILSYEFFEKPILEFKNRWVIDNSQLKVN